jgi:tetratricopeptide (TPR) repeat protein
MAPADLMITQEGDLGAERARRENLAAAPDVIPSSGRLFDRVGDRRALSRFLNDRARRVCILRGFPGVGKSVLVAQIAEQNANGFESVFWIGRREDEEDSADSVFARLDNLLRATGDGSLEGPRQISDEAKRLDKLVEATMLALSRRPFLVVFDDFGSQLRPTRGMRNAILSRLITEFASVGRTSKMILITDRRLSYNEGGGAAPAGTILEQELFGLPSDAVRQLMRECGAAVDASVSDRIAGQLSGNPTAIRMLCALATRQYLDPLAALEEIVDPKAPFTSLLGRAASDLSDASKSALTCMSLLRRPIGWDWLSTFGMNRQDVVALLDRSLVQHNPSTRGLFVPELVRRFVREGMTSIQAAQEAHARLAAGYEALVVERKQGDLDRATLRLEAGYHHGAAGNSEALAVVALPAVEAVITWGYASLAEETIEHILADGPQNRARPQALYERGRIADQRGRHEAALEAFGQAMDQTSDDRLRARCLFYRGRIKSAQGEPEIGQGILEECIALSRLPDVGVPTAAAVLALAWARKESGASAERTLDAFQEALDEAEREQDLITQSDAHRQLGFLSWTFSKRRELARSHFARAMRLARVCRALPQQAAIFGELGYLLAEWGRPDLAIRHCIRAIKLARSVGDDFLLPSVYVNLGRAYWARDQLKATRAWFDKAIDVFRRNRNPGGEAYARHELGRLLAHQGQAGAARKELDKAAKICRAGSLAGQLRSIEATLDQLEANP